MFHVPRRAGNHPRRLAGVLIVLICGVLALAAWTGVRTAEPTALAQAPVAELKRPPVVTVSDLPELSASLATHSRFMGGILVARGDQVLFRWVQGPANADEGRPLALDTPFRLASVSKQFTAVAILKLQDEGRLTISDPVCRWIQPCPLAWAGIRIHHLLSHTSGIPDLMARPAWGLRRVTPTNLAELTADSARYPLQFEPGTKIRYNNAGFNLAAAIVEKASGMPFETYLDTALFEPLGLTHTGLGETPDLAMGYANFPSGLAAQPQANVSVVTGAGALYSTLDDMLAWQRALHGGRILSPYSYAQMIADHSPADTPDERGRPHRAWGYGIFANRLGRQVQPSFEAQQIYHTGSWSGFRNLVIYQPEEDITVIVLSNNYHQRDEVFLLAQQALAEALGRPFPTTLSRGSPARPAEVSPAPQD
ncbi:serine hydrolase [Brevundimonas sp.]|uniref:serine hydrolase domain-containing protein n=1 Tax=Brevundimonas sp. TaxID=1871086 RepID=UPI0025C46B43|nr:serine hydrolase domain-containing protein [Brevundimonas sp.]